MFLQRKIDRAMKWSRERRMREDGRDPEREALEEAVRNKGKGKWKKESLPSMEEIRREEAELNLTKKDMFALIFSGMITIMPVVILIMLALCLVIFLFFFA